MDKRLIPLNAVLALLRGDGGWPAPLREQGFSCERLELPVTTAASGLVIDVLAHDQPARCVLTIEAKSGANVDDSQASKYLSLEVAAIRRVLTMPGADDRTVIQPMLCCLAENEERIRIGLWRSEAAMREAQQSQSAELLRWALVVVGTDRVRLDTPPGSPVQPFEVEVPAPPPRVVPFDAESSDSELREPLLAAIIAAAAQGQERVPVADLIGRIVPSVYGRAARSKLRKRAEQALRALAGSQDFLGRFNVIPGGQEVEGDILRILDSPLKAKPQGQTQQWQALRRRAHRSLRGGAAPAIPGQGTFDLLRKETEAGEED